MGVAGAGLASSLSVAAGVGAARRSISARSRSTFISVRAVATAVHVWPRMINIGLPAGGEFGLMFVFMAVIYWVIREFGAAAQAGFGLGMRLMQSIFLPAMAIAFATGPIAGQNFGAKLPARVRETFSRGHVQPRLMVALTLVCQFRPNGWSFFTKDPAVVRRRLALPEADLLQLRSVRTGVRVLRHFPGPRPHLARARQQPATRVATFMLPAIWLSTLPGFRSITSGILSVASMWLQAAISLYLLHRTMRQRLG